MRRRRRTGYRNRPSLSILQKMRDVIALDETLVPFGQANGSQLESLILAQNERWRQA